MRLKEFLNRDDPMTGDVSTEQPEDTQPRDGSSPDGAYDDHKAKVAELIEQIGELVEQHTDNQSGSSDQWSHAGEMAEVVAKLQEVVDMLSPEGEDDDGEVDQVSEGKNHMGDAAQETYSGWKRACKAKDASVWIDGDADIAQAMVGPKPYKRGETKQIGEWDGASGCVYK
jgi:hypothetical protein